MSVLEDYGEGNFAASSDLPYAGIPKSIEERVECSAVIIPEFATLLEQLREIAEDIGLGTAKPHPLFRFVDDGDRNVEGEIVFYLQFELFFGPSSVELFTALAFEYVVIRMVYFRYNVSV